MEFSECFVRVLLAGGGGGGIVRRRPRQEMSGQIWPFLGGAVHGADALIGLFLWMLCEVDAQPTTHLN